jgi:D-arabinose 1-dehydrogenase-like Zn-dependent alcohol dehydrogenase
MQYDAIEVQAYNAASPADAAQVVQKTVKETGQGEVLVQMKYAGVRLGCCVLLLLWGAYLAF